MRSHAILAALAALLISSASVAAPVCEDREKFLKALSDQYSEHLASIGVTPDGKVVELLVSPKKATWTLVLTAPSGKSCAVAAGLDWSRPPPDDSKLQYSLYSFY